MDRILVAMSDLRSSHLLWTKPVTVPWQPAEKRIVQSSIFFEKFVAICRSFGSSRRNHCDTFSQDSTSYHTLSQYTVTSFLHLTTCFLTFELPPLGVTSFESAAVMPRAFMSASSPSTSKVPFMSAFAPPPPEEGFAALDPFTRKVWRDRDIQVFKIRRGIG